MKKMSERRIVILQNEPAWSDFLTEAFSDTPSVIQTACDAEEGTSLLRKGNPDVVFAAVCLLTRPIAAALQTHRATNPHFRVFRLGPAVEQAGPYPFDGGFDALPSSLQEFHKRLVEALPVPDPIRLLVVDDEPGVGEAFREYFEHRARPSYLLTIARNGVEAEERFQAARPDVLVLDIKMPEKDGREVYRDLKAKGVLPPTIVFLDLFAADEVLEIRRWGSPAFVEKGAASSSMPALEALIKKLAFFG